MLHFTHCLRRKISDRKDGDWGPKTPVLVTRWTGNRKMSCSKASCITK